MSCSICNQAGHDEELHGEEGAEILDLRMRLGELQYEVDEYVRRNRSLKMSGVTYATPAVKRLAVALAKSRETPNARQDTKEDDRG